jgi:hypothetical protein
LTTKGIIMPIAAECKSCHKRFKANDKLAGKKVKCPQCGGVIQIPTPPPPKEEEGDLYALAEQPGAPAPGRSKPEPQPESARNCPSCGAGLVENAVLCVVCGHDLRSGRKLQTGHAAEAAAAGPAVTLKRKDWAKEEQEQRKKVKKKKPKRERGETPQAIAFLRGCAVAFMGAMIGVMIWCALGWFTWGDWGLMAVLVGVLTGSGMMVGYGHEDALPGIASAVIAFVGIIIGKVLVFVVIFMSIVGGAADEFADELAEEEMFAEETFADDAMIDEEYPEEEISEVAPTGEGQVADGEMGQVASDLESLDAGTAADLPLDQDYGDEDAEEPIGGAFAELIAELVITGWYWDLIWMAIGCAAAFKVGSGGQWWED